MGFINDILRGLAKSRLGSNFEDRVMQAVEGGSLTKDDAISDIVEHYKAIIKLLSPQYKCVGIDAEDLTMLVIDGVKYDLDDKSTLRSRKAAEHRMAIEFLVADFSDQAQVISQVEAQLNKN